MAARQSSYSQVEDVLLCQVYMEISQDPMVGVYQSSDRFWTRVEENYKKSMSQEWEARSKRSLQARVQTIMKAAKKLHGCIRQIENMHQSGASNEDIMTNAKALYKKDPNYKVGWKFDHVWDIVKNFEKFQDCGGRSRQTSYPQHSSDSETPNVNSPTPGFASFSLNSGDDNDHNNEFRGSSSSRPQGVKKAKLKSKKDDTTSAMIDKLRKDNKMFMEEIKSSNAQLTHQLEVKNALRAAKEENKILYQDVSSIKDPHYRAFIEAEQARIMQKRAQHGEHNPFAIGNYATYLNNIGGSGSDLPDY